MKAGIIAAMLGTGLLFASLASGQAPRKKTAMSEDMRQAIAFERYKDLAAARQARREAIHPSVTYSNPATGANRSMDESLPGRPVKDPGPARKDKK